MSKQSLLTLANFNLFRNTNSQIEFSIAKDNRVQAGYSAYDKSKGYDVRGIRQKSAAGVGYIRLSISMIDGAGNREYHNGALFVNDKKETDKQPDFQGSVNLDNKTDGPKLRLSAWKKTGEQAGDYLSVSIQEFQSREEAASKGGNTGGGAFDMNDDAPAPAPAPAARQRPAAQQRDEGRGRAAPPARNAAPARNAPAATGGGGGGFDSSMDDDIPFATNSMEADMTTSKARKMSRYDY